MKIDCRKDFANFENHVWLNAGSEGPLPLQAKQDLLEAIEWKSQPYDLTLEKFARIPLELKKRRRFSLTFACSLSCFSN